MSSITFLHQDDANSLCGFFCQISLKQKKVFGSVCGVNLIFERMEEQRRSRITGWKNKGEQ